MSGLPRWKVVGGGDKGGILAPWPAGTEALLPIQLQISISPITVILTGQSVNVHGSSSIADGLQLTSL